MTGQLLFQATLVEVDVDGHVTVWDPVWVRPQPAGYVETVPALSIIECDGGDDEAERAAWLLAAWDRESPVSWSLTRPDGVYESWTVYPATPARFLLPSWVPGRVARLIGAR